MLWSILIAGIPERFATVHPLLFSLLETQAAARISDIEVLYLMDSRRRTVGAKRNALLGMAKGEYVSFIDDDDEVAADYVRRIYKAIQKTRKSQRPADVICFRQLAHLQPHNVTHDCSYSLEFFKNRKPEERRQLAPALGEDGKPLPNVLAWTGPPAHTQVWRRALVAETLFDERNFGEDMAWVDKCCEKARVEIQLGGEPCYIYRFDEAKTATR